MSSSDRGAGERLWELTKVVLRFATCPETDCCADCNLLRVVARELLEAKAQIGGRVTNEQAG